MSRFLRLCAFLSVLFFANNVMAAGYTCSTTMKYERCASGYYLSNCGTTQSAWTGQTVTPASGNSCVQCPSGYKCDGGTTCPLLTTIKCNPGYYLPAGATTCIKCGIAPDGTKQGGYYCPGGSFDKTAGGGRNACPAISGRVRTTHPEYFYANENMQSTGISFPTWFDVNASITDCRINYNVKNNRGSAHQEGVRYNSSTGKYDGAGGPIYYSKINAGYYGAVKHSSTYCNTASNPMYYQNALPCPAGKYCEGYANGMPLCSTGAYNDTLGITGDIAAGYWANATCGAIKSTPNADTDCALGNVNNSNAGIIHFGFYSTGGGKVPRPYPSYETGQACLDDYECGYVGAGYYVNGGGTSKNPSGFGNGCVGQWNNAGTMTNHVCGQVAPGYFSTGGAISATPATNDCHGYDVADTTDVIANRCGLIAAGYYGGSGATSNTGSGKVNAGYYSTGGGTSKTPTANGNGCVGSGTTCGLIAGGYYGGAGATTSSGSGLVDAGYYSTGGGTSKTPTANGSGCVGSGKTCGKVNPGYYSTGGGTSKTPTANGNGCVGSGKTCGLIAAGYYSGVSGATRATPNYMSGSCSGTLTINGVSYQGCGTVFAGYYSTGGGTSPVPTANGNGCVGSGKTCGMVDAGYYSTGGGTTATGKCIDGNECGLIGPGLFSTRGGKRRIPLAGYGDSLDELCLSGDNGVYCGYVASGYYSEAGGTTSQGTCVEGQSCGQVAAGYFSEGGAGSATPASGTCGYFPIDISCGKVNAGYYSTGGGTSATPTANGNGCVGSGKTCGLVDKDCFGSEGSASSCPTSCSVATINNFRYSDAGSTSINDCYATGTELLGKYVSDNKFLPCPVGSYNNALNEDGSDQRAYYGGKPTQCHICPGGKVNVEPGAISKDQCSSSWCGMDISPFTIGYDWLTPTWNDVLAGQNLCVAASCPKGYVYNTDAKTCNRCPEGHYQDVNGYKGEFCTVSAPGYYVKSTDQTKQTPCPAGEYTNTQQNSSCYKLAAGYWNNGCGTSNTGAVCSTDYSGGLIAAGYYGGSGATSNTGSGKVNAGYYSTGGGTSATPTANGNGCVGSGKTCGTIAAGYYGGAGAITNTGSGKVNAGYYSTGGGTSATPTANGNGCVGSGKTCGTIAAGYYGGAGATSATGSDKVFAGHFSTGGATTSRPTANDCVGTKSDGTANTCGLVAAGYWTSHGSKTATPTNSETDCVNKLCGILDAGYYSTGGATRSAPTEVGNHCFGTACGRVDAGYYSTGGGTSASGSCISGQECGLIKLGLYSTCGATSAGDTGGSLADKDYLDCVSGCECGRVDAGYYSTGGGTSKTPNGNGDGCIGDGNTCGTVDPGYYSRGGAGNAQPTGYFCWGYNTYSDGITGCGHVAAGYYSNGGGTMPNGTCVSGKSCGPVAAGYYATGGATSNTGNGQVAGGYFATGGATKAEPSSSDCVGSGNTCGLISGGYWSVSGAKTATPTAKTDCIGRGDDNEYCGVISGGYYSTAGATYKYPATQGVECVGDSACGKVKPGYYNNGCGINDAGSVCDTTKYEGGVVPAGYYTTGGSSMSPVAAGYYSTGGGTSATGTCLSGYKCGTVDGGYYSTGGGTSANGTCIGGKSCGLINAGYYSTGGAKKANPYLSNSCVGKKSDGTANTCGLVNGGYYSTGGGTSKTPTKNGNGCVGSGKTCGKVAVAYYSNGGGTSANGTCIEGQVCGTCDSSYRGGTLTGKTTESQCQASCAAGKRVAEPYAACSEPDGAWFTPAHLVDYGHISPVNYCMDGYHLNNEFHTGSVTSCARNLSGGQYMPSTQIAARYIKVTSGGSAQNSDTHMLEIQAFASNDGTGTNLLSGKGGNTGSKLTAATNGSWTRGAGESYAQGTDLIWDLGSVQKLGSLKFAMYTDGRVYRNLVIAVSENNQDYTTVFQDADFQTQNTTEPTPDMLVLSALPKSCESGTVNPGKELSLTQTSSCTACMGRTQFANAISQACTTIEEGEYTTGCDANGNKCTATKICDGAEYCVAGVRYDCPTPQENWTAGTGQGWSSVTQCTESIYHAVFSSHCSSGWLVRNAKTATEWADEFTEKEDVKAAPGAYIDRSGSLPTCTLCVVGSYSAGGTATACTACPAGKINDSNHLDSCTTTCSNSAGVASDGWETTKWNTDNTVTNLCTIKSNGCSANNYKNSNACSTCSSGTNSKYTSSVAGTTTVNNCYLTTTAGNYVAGAGAGQTTCAKGGYCPGSVKVYYGGTSSDTHPTTGGRTQCPAGYQDGTTGYSLESQCLMNVDGGHYVASAKESTASGECDTGYAKIAHTVPYGETSSCSKCTGPTYANEKGMEKCMECPPAIRLADKKRGYSYYSGTGKNDTVSGCRVELNTTELTHGTTTGNGMRCKYIEADKDYGNGYCELTVGTMKCNPGYYSKGASTSYWGVTGYENLLNNACIAVEEGYWSPADSLTRTACASGLTTCGSGLCANDAGDCGRKLHAGDKVIHLRSEKRTTPSMVVNIGGTKFYGNLGAVIANSLRVKNGTNNYSVVNDNQ